ncbi:hypothetical protein [Bacillus cereus group sp. BfR-BA-01489]|uniref:response regulator aspartate phosphatase n=1 Tax=Bacillus cereus group TaxID=86661 RepID=UPI001F5A9F1C
MNVQMKGNEQISKLLNDWYQAILQHQNVQATNLKQEVEDKLSSIKEDKNLLLYYSLLDFRYKVLTDGLNITKDSFNEINSFDVPDSGFLSYYYHFFKAVHETIISNYNKAKEEFEKAEKLLIYALNEVEEAEFNYRFSVFSYHTRQPINTLQYANKAKEIFSKYTGYETSIALCENVLGLTSIQIEQYEQAEEYLNSTINILQKQNEETLLLRVRHNLGWLYASQNLSKMAIRHLSEVTENIPNHFKAIFLEAREYYKMGEINNASQLIEKGLKICFNLENEEYTHHFKILKAMNEGVTIDQLEVIIMEGISYCNDKQLYNFIKEYAETLAIKFYEEDNHLKASKYFYIANQASEKKKERGALK